MPMFAGGPPAFAAAAPFAAAPAAFAGPVPPPPPAPGATRSRAGAGPAAPKRAAVSLTGSMPVPPAADPGDLREVVALEIQRLEKDASLPDWERRDLLADLASRLGILIAGRTGPAYGPMRGLFVEIEAGGDVDRLWARTLEVLREFVGEGTPAEPERRRRFWR